MDTKQDLETEGCVDLSFLDDRSQAPVPRHFRESSFTPGRGGSSMGPSMGMSRPMHPFMSNSRTYPQGPQGPSGFQPHSFPSQPSISQAFQPQQFQPQQFQQFHPQQFQPPQMPPFPSHLYQLQPSFIPRINMTRKWEQLEDTIEGQITKIGQMDVMLDSVHVLCGHSGIDENQIIGMNVSECKAYILEHMNKTEEYLAVIPVEIGSRKAIITIQHGYGYIFKIIRSPDKFTPYNSPDSITPLMSVLLVSRRSSAPSVRVYLTNNEHYIFLGNEIYNALHTGASSELGNILFMDAAINSHKPIEFLKSVSRIDNIDCIVEFTY